MALLQPEDRRELSEQVCYMKRRFFCDPTNSQPPLQILASAHAGAEASKQFAALEHAVAGYMSQLEGGSGGGDHDAVLRGLQAAVSSAQAQVCPPDLNFYISFSHFSPVTII